MLAWTLGVSLATGIIFGLVPALEATRLNLNDALKEGGKGTGGQGVRSRRLRGALVVAEVALALVLLASAGLLVKSFVRLQEIDTGFNTENVLTMVVRLPDGKYKEDPQIVAFFRQAMERMRALPGVRDGGDGELPPALRRARLRDRLHRRRQARAAAGRGVDHERARGRRGLLRRDGHPPAARPQLHGRGRQRRRRRVIIISETLARQYFPGEDPLGKRISVDMFDEPEPTEIIGIVGDVRYDSLTDEARPTVYFPHPELTYSFMTLAVRTERRPGGDGARPCGASCTRSTRTSPSRTCGR